MKEGTTVPLDRERSIVNVMSSIGTTSLTKSGPCSSIRGEVMPRGMAVGYQIGKRREPRG